MKRTILLLLLFISVPFFGQQKNYVNLQIKKILVHSKTIQIDTFSIQPFYFEVFLTNGKKIPSKNYQIDFVTSKLTFSNSNTYLNQYILVKYLVYPKFLRKEYMIIDLTKIDNSKKHKITFFSNKKQEQKLLTGLQTKGSISRGVNIGNNQSMVMQSGLDLEIRGKIAENVHVKAVLSDTNMPQAYAGISQSYKEFDRIYMQLSGKNWQVTGGDIIKNNNESYFLKFSRKTQGIDASFQNNSNQISIFGGYVEGKFAINRFYGIEGNQGPYLLKGMHSENYIFIIPNTEKVYVNGKLLKNKNEYEINYETAELIFNPSFIITQNQRIVVEFNYSNQHYLRYVNYNRFQTSTQKKGISVFTFIESDVKNKTLLYHLTDNQYHVLKNSGDRLNELFVESAVSSSYHEQKILYKKIPSTTAYYYEYTSVDEPDLYEVKFSFVGKNKGDYQLDRITARGKIYKYTGTNSGDYNPVIKLTAPKSNKYVGTQFYYHPSAQTNINFEALVSHNDKNLFSEINDDDNFGVATHFTVNQDVISRKKKRLFTRLQYDFIHKNYIELDQYRSPEFNRIWQIDSLFGKQHLVDFSLNYQNDKQLISSGIKHFRLRDSIQTNQIFIKADLQFHKLKWKSDFKIISQKKQKTNTLSASFLEQEIALLQKKYDIGLRLQFENRNKVINSLLDTLNFRYSKADFYYANKDTSRIAIKMGYKIEQNDSILWNNLFRFRKIHTLYIHFQRKTKNAKIGVFSHYRKLQLFREEKERELLNLKLFYHQYLFGKVILFNSKIENYNGNTLRDEIVYVETPRGQGTHIWVDYNQNGIKEINEFEVANFSDEANYMRVILPSKNYVATVNNAYLLHFIFNPITKSNNKFIKKIYADFRFDSKEQSVNHQRNICFFGNDSDVLYKNTLWRTNLYYNRTQKRYFLHFIYQNLSQKQLLLVGKQSMQVEKYSLETKHAFAPHLIWQQKFSIIDKARTSEDYVAKNYKIKSKIIEQKLDLKQTKSSKFGMYYRLENSENLSATESLESHQFGLIFYKQNTKKSNFQADIKYVNNQIEGNAYSPVAFQMLKGLKKGNNLVFNTLYQTKITTYLDLNLNYTFRISENSPAIHAGGVALKMIF